MKGEEVMNNDFPDPHAPATNDELRAALQHVLIASEDGGTMNDINFKYLRRTLKRRTPTKKEADHECPPILLTAGDWAEIYYALESKVHYIRGGKYGSDEASNRWTKHLNSIIDKIGADGIDAAMKGTITILRRGKPL